MSDLFLGPLEPEHLPQIQEWRNASWTREHVREWRYLTMEHLKAWYADQLTDPFQEFMGVFTIDDMGEDRLVGVVGLTGISWTNRTAEVSVLDYARDMGGGAIELASDDEDEWKCLDLLITFARKVCNLRWLRAETYTDVREALVESHDFVKTGQGLPVWRDGKYVIPWLWQRTLTADAPPESAPATPHPGPGDSP